jgi:hypothetical protein
MNAVQLENNYYTVIDGVNVYVDYYSDMNIWAKSLIKA